jgi:chromosome segregation ATPase
MNHSSTKDYGSREPGWTCEDEIDCLRADLERAEKELVELRLLEMNHEGACVRLKAEVMSLRSDVGVRDMEVARLEADVEKWQRQTADSAALVEALRTERDGALDEKETSDRVASDMSIACTQQSDRAELAESEVEATRAERDTALAHLENFKSVDRALSAILRKLAAIHRLHRL